MSMSDAVPPAMLLGYKVAILEKGWTPVEAEYTNPSTTKVPLLYTVGLCQKGLPELVIKGMPVKQALPLLYQFVTRHTRHTPPITDGVLVEGISKVVWKPFALSRRQTVLHLPVLNALFPGSSAIQLLWPDKGGAFPDEPAYAWPREEQALV